MIATYVPIMRQNDYETFRRLMHSNIPDTYNEWRYLLQKLKDDAILRGETVREIEIYPDDLTRYASAHGNEYTMQTIKNLAFEKGGGNK